MKTIYLELMLIPNTSGAHSRVLTMPINSLTKCR